MTKTASYGPPRPKAIASFISSEDFLPGCQTLLHSVKKHLAPTPEDQYGPEIILLMSSRIKQPHVVVEKLCPIFCDRVITVDHIPINCEDKEENADKRPSHVQAWDDNCGWTKLRLFELSSYDTILYIDADCLVVKDVGRLLDIGVTHTNQGLLAAAPDIFPPDKFNAGVMVLRPSKEVFDKMMLSLPKSKSEGLQSYDGGDTGFLNNFYSDWYSSPSYVRLSFGYNAQRLMHHCTYDKQPSYWDDGISDLRIIHFSSSPKPWESRAAKSKANGGEEKSEGKKYLTGSDVATIQQVKRGKLERLFDAAHEASQEYYWKQQSTAEYKAYRKMNPTNEEKKTVAKTKAKAAGAKSLNKRYKELRKKGMSTKDAMETARREFHVQDQNDPSKAVGQMFGL